jgi:hypothetical protein
MTWDGLHHALVCETRSESQERRQLRTYFVVAALWRRRSSLPGRQV